jgi:hypothetical protein
MRLGHCARQFKSRNCLLASDRRKALEKLVQRISGFEVVVQRLDGHPGPDKNRSAAEDLRVAVYDWRFVRQAICNLTLSTALWLWSVVSIPLRQPAADIVP